MKTWLKDFMYKGYSIDNYPSTEEVNAIKQQAVTMDVANWLFHDVFTWQWWVLCLLMVVPWFIFAKLVDKKRLSEILFYGLTIMIITITLDEIGSELGFWIYPYKLIGIFSRLTSIDYTTLPVIYMLVYQYFKTWPSFLSASVVLATVCCFVCEPALTAFDMYRLMKWKYYYGFPIYILQAYSARWFTLWVFKITSRS